MATLTLTLDDIMTGIRAFFLAALPSGVEVVQGQRNRVAPPKVANYVIMTPLLRQRLSLNVDTWPVGAAAPTTLVSLSPGQLTVQCDIFGPASADYAAVVETLWQSPWGVDFLGEYGDMAPLYLDPPRQFPLVDGEQQYQDRWSVSLALQVNQTVTFDQTFANELQAGVISVDATYPPS